MTKAAKLTIKGIILSLLFVFAFNLSITPKYEASNSYATTAIESEGQAEVKLADFWMPEALAQDANEKKPKQPSELMQDAINFIAGAATYMHRFFNPLINFFAFQTGNFLATDYIFEGAMGGMLKNIWVVSRNIVNIIFVLILLGLALREIFWLKEESGELKKSLIKFALLLVAVNFSWMATKVVLDAANVATNVVFSIPMGVSSAGIMTDAECSIEKCTGKDEKCEYKTVGLCYPTAIYAPMKTNNNRSYIYMKDDECKTNKIEEKYNEAYGTKENKFKEEKNAEYYGKATYCWGPLDFAKYNKNTSTVYLTYGMARIQNLVNASADEDVVQLSVGIVMSILLQVVYTVALLALFIALIIRMAFLWVFVAFSPFLIVLFYWGGWQKGVGGESGKFSIEDFLKWAFVPVGVGAVFSVAFIMVSAGQAIGLSSPETFDTLGKGGVEVTTKLFKVKSLFMGMDSIQEFIWLLITLVILWMGTFAVLGKMPVVSKITEKINGYGKEAGAWLAKTPYWAPIMPMIDPETGDFKFGSIKRDIVKKVDIVEILKDKHNQVMEGDKVAKLYKKARELDDGDRSEMEGNFEKKDEASAKAFLGKFDLALDEWKELPDKVRTELLGLSRVKNANEIKGWLDDAAKKAAKTSGAGAAVTTTARPSDAELEREGRLREKGAKEERGPTEQTPSVGQNPQAGQ